MNKKNPAEGLGYFCYVLGKDKKAKCRTIKTKNE
jgi:hypothetical protein